MGLLSLTRTLLSTPAQHLADHLQMHTRFQTVIDAKADYGCVFDGTTDDAANLQAAIDAGGANSAIIVNGPRVKHSAAIRIESDNQALIGLGAGERLNATQTGAGTRFEPTSAVTGQAIKVQRVANDRPVLGTYLLNFAVEGQALGTAVDGILYRSNRGAISNVAVYRMTGNGIQMQGYAGWSLYDTRVGWVQAGANAAAGIYLNTRAEDLHFLGCILFTNQDGFRISSASEQILGCHTYDNTRYGYFFDAGGTRTKVVGAKVEGNKGGGARLETTSGNGMSDIQLVGCGFANNWDVTNNVIDDIYIGGDAATGCSRTMISACSFSNKGGGGASVKGRSAINLVNNAAQSTNITGNTFARSSATSHYATSEVINNGNTSQYLKAYIRNNQGLADMVGGQANWGTGTIASGATTAVITHGLDFTPVASNIEVVQTSTATNQGPFWVTTIGATTFTVNHIDPGAGGVNFSWKATT